MKLGVNLIAPTALPVIRAWIMNGRADFCEIMVDNFIHLDPHAVRALLPNIPVAFHLVATRFLERDQDSLKTLAKRLRAWIDVFSPQYVSDHLVYFTQGQERLSIIREPSYADQAKALKHAVARWQAELNVTLYLENHASLTSAGLTQAEFFHELIAETGCGLLFDASNALIAERNIALSRSAWHALMVKTPHWHVGGFKQDTATKLWLDTHDEALDPQALSELKFYTPETLLLEVDAKQLATDWLNLADTIRRPTQKLTHSFIVKPPDPDKAAVVLAKRATLERLMNALPLFKQWTESASTFAETFLSAVAPSALNWALSLHFLTWLEARCSLPDNVKLEFIKAAAIRWALQNMEHPDALKMRLSVPELPGVVVEIHKSAAPLQGHRVQVLSWTETEVGYAVFKAGEPLTWLAIPA